MKLAQHQFIALVWLYFWPRNWSFVLTCSLRLVQYHSGCTGTGRSHSIGQSINRGHERASGPSTARILEHCPVYGPCHGPGTAISLGAGLGTEPGIICSPCMA